MDRKLGIYLNDYLAGAAYIVALAKRMQHENAGSYLGNYMLEFIADAEEDVTLLEDLIQRLGGRRNPIKKRAVQFAVKFGRLKLNGTLLAYSELSRLEEIEGLLLGVRAKIDLWTVLDDLFAKAPDIEGVEFTLLLERARRQEAQLERHRMTAAREAFLHAA